jgi:hypothetical protein
MEFLQKIFLIILVSLVFVGCKTVENKEQITIRERVLNNSFDVGGIAQQDTIKQELYVWDTIIKRVDKFDTVRTTFNEITKYQTIKLISQPDTLRDTTQTKTKTIYIKVVPKWVWGTLLVGIVELIIIIILARFR